MDKPNEFSHSVAVVIPQQPTQPFTALDRARNRTDFVTGLNQFVFEPLMISFAMIMLEENGDCPTQRFLTEENHPRKRLGFYAFHESLDVGIQVGASWRQQ